MQLQSTDFVFKKFSRIVGQDDVDNSTIGVPMWSVKFPVINLLERQRQLTDQDFIKYYMFGAVIQHELPMGMQQC